MTPARFRKLVLALDGVTEVPHMDRAAFRTKRKIFATLGSDKRVNMTCNPKNAATRSSIRFPIRSSRSADGRASVISPSTWPASTTNCWTSP